MAKPGNLTWSKRSRELAKKDKRDEKLRDRNARKEEKKNRLAEPGGTDPDIAGIVPGPQPVEI